MNNEYILLLGVLYIFNSIVYTIYEIFFVYRKKSIETITYIRGMFTIIYGYAHTFMYIGIYNGEYVNYLDVTPDGIKKLYILYIMSVGSYIAINFGYTIFGKIKLGNSENKKGSRYTDKILFYSANLMLLIGTISLFLWSKMFGGPIGILKYANALRAGMVEIYNPWSVVMKFCMLSLLATYIYIALIAKNKKNIKYKIFFSLSMISSILYLLANSSRMMLIMYFIFMFLIYNQVQHEYFGKKISVKKYVILILVGLILMSSSEMIMNIFQSKEITKDFNINMNIFNILKKEFFFVPVSGQTALTAIGELDLGLRGFTDIISGFLAWLPSRFRPENLPHLEKINTLIIIGTTKYGYMPPDLIGASIYDWGYCGILLTSSLLGIIAKKLEVFKYRNKKSVFINVFYILISFYLLKAVGYADFANIMSNIFYLFIGIIIIVFIKKIGGGLN